MWCLPCFKQWKLDRVAVHQHKLCTINQEILEIQLAHSQYSNFNILTCQVEQHVNDIFFTFASDKQLIWQNQAFNIKEISYGLNFHSAFAYIFGYAVRFILV